MDKTLTVPEEPMTEEERKAFMTRCQQRNFEKALREKVRSEDGSVIYRDIKKQGET